MRTDRVVTSLDAADVGTLVRCAHRRADLDGLDRRAEAGAVADLWTGTWSSSADRTRGRARPTVARPWRWCCGPRPGRSARQGCPHRTAQPARRALAPAPDPRRPGRRGGPAWPGRGNPWLRAQLTALGLVPRRASRGAVAGVGLARDVDAAFARRRLVVAELTHLLRHDPAAAHALALATSHVPAEVAPADAACGTSSPPDASTTSSRPGWSRAAARGASSAVCSCRCTSP